MDPGCLDDGPGGLGMERVGDVGHDEAEDLGFATDQTLRSVVRPIPKEIPNAKSVAIGAKLKGWQKPERLPLPSRH